MAIRFWCALCGKPLEADDRDAGRGVECAGCKAVVTVPRNPATDDPELVEDDPDGPVVFAPATIASARTGLWLLRLSVIVFAAQMAVGIGIVATRVATDGPFNAYGNGLFPGDSLAEKAAVVAIAGGLARGVLRFLGCQLCLRLGRRIETGSSLVAAMIGVVIYTGGTVLLELPPLSPPPGPLVVPLTLMMLAFGATAAISGFCLEWGVVRFLADLLRETRGEAAVKQVEKYRKAFTVPVVIGAIVYILCATGFLFFTAAPGPVPGNAAFGPGVVADFFALLIIAAAVLAYVFGVILCWQYARLLSVCRASLLAARLSPSGNGGSVPTH